MISLRSILSGMATRFIPALLVGLAAFFVAVRLGDVAQVGWWYLAQHLGLVSLGYLVTLVAVRRWLRSDTDVAGRRGVVAGVMAPFAYFSAMILVPYTTPDGMNAMALGVGIALALGLYFPWLQFGAAAGLGGAEVNPALESGVRFSELDAFESHRAGSAGRMTGPKGDEVPR